VDREGTLSCRFRKEKLNIKDFLVFGVFAFGLGGIAWVAAQWFVASFQAYIVFMTVVLYGLMATAVFLLIAIVAVIALTSAFYMIRAIFKKDSAIDG
jgi:hypothetical protein